jgi:hypothetical protein
MKFKGKSPPPDGKRGRGSIATLLQLSPFSSNSCCLDPDANGEYVDGSTPVNSETIEEFNLERKLKQAIVMDDVNEVNDLMSALDIRTLDEETKHTRFVPIFTAVENDSRNVVRNLLSKIEPGDLVDLRDVTGRGLLHVVKSRECAKLLLEHVSDKELQKAWILNKGAKVNSGHTPLHAMVILKLIFHKYHESL